MKSLIVALGLTWLFLPLKSPVAFAASITLNSDEIMEGAIISETDAEIRLQMANQDRTIVFTRVIQKSDIKSITRDTPEEKAQHTAYCALDNYKLDRFQHLSTSQYKQGIDAFEKFLSDYPESTHADEIRDKLAEWKTEADNLRSGKVKFAGSWMTPKQRAPLLAEWQRRQRLEAARLALNDANNQLAKLQLQRDQLATSMPILQANLRTSQNALAMLHDSQERQYQTDVIPFKPYYDASLGRVITGPDRKRITFVGYKNIPNPQRGRLEKEVASYQAQLDEAPRTLATLDVELADLHLKLPKLEADYESAQPAPALPSAPQQR